MSSNDSNRGRGRGRGRPRKIEPRKRAGEKPETGQIVHIVGNDGAIVPMQYGTGGVLQESPHNPNLDIAHLTGTINMNRSTNIVAMQCIDVRTLRDLFNNLSNSIEETAMIWTPEGIRFRGKSCKSKGMIFVDLWGDKFETYYCSRRFATGIDVKKMHQIIKLIESDSVFTVYITEENPTNIKIEIDICDSDTIENRQYEVALTDLAVMDLDLPQENYLVHAEFESAYLQRKLDEINAIGDGILSIKVVNDEIILSCNGAGGDKIKRHRCTIKRGSGKKGLLDLTLLDRTEIVANDYSMNEITKFCKKLKMWRNIIFHLDNEAPLLIEHNVGTMGSIYLWLPSKDDEDRPEIFAKYFRVEPVPTPKMFLEVEYDNVEDQPVRHWTQEANDFWHTNDDSANFEEDDAIDGYD